MARARANAIEARKRTSEIEQRRFIPPSPEAGQGRKIKKYRENPMNQELPMKDEWWDR